MHSLRVSENHRLLSLVEPNKAISATPKSQSCKPTECRYVHYPADPFLLKRLPKWHITRVAWTAYARAQERIAALSFASTAVPIKLISNVAECPEPEKEETAVTGLQLSYLIAALRATEPLSSTIVEVGSYRGATTLALASETRRSIVAVDPYIGYGGAEVDREAFLKRVGNFINVKHLRLTSGEAARTWSHGTVSFVFIDAVHDYVNTRYDIKAWRDKLMSGGLMALHDTDNPQFPGTRKAASAALKNMDLWAHINDLVILRKRS
jgi:predicted O-methyltransferase YrrM